MLSEVRAAPQPTGPRVSARRTATRIVSPAKGAIKVATGKALGDSKLAAEGKSDEVEGKIQKAVGGLKDALKDSLKKK